jgi:hypothetical protein
LAEPEVRGESDRRAAPRLALTALLLLAAVGLGTGLWLAAGAGDGRRTELVLIYEQSFKGNGGNREGLQFVGRNADECVRFEPDGLRIRLPRGHTRESPTGVGTKVPFHGDFEVTVSFEILEEPDPAETGPKPGTRFSLGVELDTPQRNVASMSRGIGPGAGPQFIPWMTVWDPGSAKNAYRDDAFPAQGKGGRLRLERTGSMLAYYASEGLSNEFTLIQRYPFGADDVRQVRAVGLLSGPNASLDVRVTDLRIRAQSAPEPPASQPPASQPPASQPPASQPPASGSRGWVAAAMLLVLITILCGVGLWLYLRQWRLADKAPPGPAGPDNQSPPGAPPTVAVACPGCGKKLKVRAALAGKKVKCPQCGQAILVPETSATEPARPRPGRWLIGLAVVAALLISGVVVGAALIPPRGQTENKEWTQAVGRVKALETDTVDARSFVRVTDKDLVSLHGLPNLRRLNLDHAEVTDEGLKEVAGLTRLMSLSLTDTRVTDAGLAELTPLVGLENFRLDGLPITDAGLARLKAFPQLRNPSLFRTRVTDAGLVNLKELRSLDRLSLDETRVSDAGVPRLVEFPSLNHLGLWHTDVTSAGIRKLREARPELEITGVEGLR